MQDQPLHLSFKDLWNANSQGLRVISEGGLVLIRELDERLGFGGIVEEYPTDARAKNARSPFAEENAPAEIVRQSH